MKTIAYVDGYNLYYGCLKHSAHKWLDIWLLMARILKAQNPQADLIQVKFFTADIKAKLASRGQLAQHAQQSYHRALQQIHPDKIQIEKGFHRLERASLLAYNKPPDKNNRVDVWRLEEKETDVNIALSAYRDAVKENAEQFVFVSNDTDLAPAVKALREDFANNIVIGVITPVLLDSERPDNKKLSKFSDWVRHHITEDELAGSHLPLQIPTNKKPIKKPSYW